MEIMERSKTTLRAMAKIGLVDLCINYYDDMKLKPNGMACNSVAKKIRRKDEKPGDATFNRRPFNGTGF